MEVIFAVSVLGIIIMSSVAFFVGKKVGNPGNNKEKVLSLESSVAELTEKLAIQKEEMSSQASKMIELTSDRDVQKTNAENAAKQLESQRLQYETLREQDAERNEKLLSDKAHSYEKQIDEQKCTFEKRIEELKQEASNEKKAAVERQTRAESEIRSAFERQIAELKASFKKQFDQNKETTDKQLEALREMNKKQAEGYELQIEEVRKASERQIEALKESYSKQLNQNKEHADKQLLALQEMNKKQANAYEIQIEEVRKASEKQIEELKESYSKQLNQNKEHADKQLEVLREMNKKQVEDQLNLIKEQMRTTSESVLKVRQEELGAQNKEQVSKIIDPLQKSLKDMEQALNSTKEQQKEALTRLDETIKLNMEKSASLGETADRLTRALTGEVKVQGNFGELKLKQLLEDLELKEGEQFDTQETLKDNLGRGAKGDDGKGLIPDFILHFPNNRHVVVDSKMSLTDYERYMNTEDGVPEKSGYLKAHINSVRAQVKRLARKEYTKYLPSGYNKLNFAIMYVPIEGALNLALLNDTTLWREAYDQGVMILGPQTMYMNLRVLEMMWTQVRQLNNQQAMMDAANTIIDRVQDFGIRFKDVESSMNDTIKKITKLKTTTADNGPSIITAARNLLKAGAKENKKKKGLADMDNSIFIEANSTVMLPPNKPKENASDNGGVEGNKQSPN